MRNLVRRFLGTLGRLFGLHLEYENLLAYRDKELGCVRSWYSEVHLSHCQNCQRKSEQIEHDLQGFQKMDALNYRDHTLNISQSLEHLCQAIHYWEARTSLDGESSERGQRHREMDLRRLATEFDLYLGHNASMAFLRKMKSNEKKQKNPLAEAESVLRDFLGPVAASAVTQRIVHLQMSTDRRAQGSPLA